MMRTKLGTCALLLALGSSLHAATLPSAGMSMQAVESQFGQPLKKNVAVGQPPITRWEYDGYVVVFERSTVVGSVSIQRADTSPRTAAPAASAKTGTAPAVAPPAPAAATAAPVRVPVEAAPAPAPAAAPAESAAPAATTPGAKEAPAPAAESPPAPAASPSADVAGQDAMAKAAAEKAAAEAPSPAPAADAPAPPNDGYVFDPETGRIILK